MTVLCTHGHGLFSHHASGRILKKWLGTILFKIAQIVQKVTCGGVSNWENEDHAGDLLPSNNPGPEPFSTTLLRKLSEAITTPKEQFVERILEKAKQRNFCGFEMREICCEAFCQRALYKKSRYTRALASYFSEAAKRRSRCGSVRGWPVLSSHFSPGLAPHVGQRTVMVTFFLAFIAASCNVVYQRADQL
jgi:hypothetical protein